MKKIHALLLAASVLFAASCQEEIASPEAENPEVGTSTLEVITITATTQSETKTALDGLSTLWVKGDMISVFDANKDGNNRCFPVVEITNENKTATFSYEEGDFKMDHTQKDPTLVALYPYQKSAYCDFFYYDRNYIKNLVVPAEQTAVANGFDANATFAIALGTMNTRESLNFQNLYSLLKFHVETPNVTSVTVTVGGENAYIAGDAKVQMQLNKELINNEEGKPVFFDPVLSALPDGGSKSVTLKCEEGFSTDEDVFYYIAVAPTTIESVQVAINETVVKSATKEMSFEANKIHSLRKLDYNRIDRELAFDSKECKVTLGDEFVEPKLTGEVDGVTYESSNTAVATVDAATGEVTLLAAGETTITATAPKTESLLEGTAEYTLTVNKAARNLAFAVTSGTATYGDDFELPELTCEGDFTNAVYTVTAGDAATVTKAGVVTLVKAGTMTIKATVAEDETHLAGEATYTLTVNKAARNLAFAVTSGTATYGDDFTLPALNGAGDLTNAKYVVVEGDAAIVTEGGKVTLVKAGTVTIKTTVAEDETHLAGEATYTLTVKQYVYLVPNINWCDAGARFAAYFYADGKSEKWVDMTKDKNMYKCEVEAGYTNVIFCRMNPSQKENNWDNRWNQTGNLDVPKDNQMYYFINGWGDNSSWKTQDFCKTYFNASGKLYLVPTGGWKQNNERYAAYFYENGKQEKWLSLVSTTDFSYFNGAYNVTPPSGYTNIIFCRMNGSQNENKWDNKWDQTADLKVSGGSLYTMPDAKWITISY